jgi:hypothetical protein
VRRVRPTGLAVQRAAVRSGGSVFVLGARNGARFRTWVGDVLGCQRAKAMTKAQRKAYKADNRQRREVEAVLARLPKPRSKTSLRKRFEAAHDEWRAAAGMDPIERNNLTTERNSER